MSYTYVSSCMVQDVAATDYAQPLHVLACMQHCICMQSCCQYSIRGESIDIEVL